MAGDHDDFKILLNGFRSFEQFHAVHDRQPKIGHQNVDVVFIQQVKRLLTVIGFDDHVFSGLQDFRHRSAIFRIVFDEEDLGCFSYRHIGNKIENVDPLPAWLSMTRCPLCSKIICCDVASPSPVPCAFVVKNGSNSLV